MPSAAKLVKQASTEANDPLRQGITILEHKIRNLEKRKAKLETYRALQAEGKELQTEQLAAVAKYDEVLQSLDFTRDLCKQFNTIAADAVKAAKKQARKDALERQANDLSRIKDVLVFHNVLNLIGTDAVREDFLNGRNGAVQLTDADLQLFDNFYETVTPKVFEEAKSPVDAQLAAAAEHFLYAIDGKSKEFSGVTYAAVKEKIMSVHSCGYFDKPATQPPSDAPAEAEEAPGQEDQEEQASVQEPLAPPEEVTSAFQPDSVAPQHQIPPQAPPQVPLRPHDVITSVTSGSFNFLQESELDSPDPAVPPSAPVPHQMPPAIPSQGFTNPTFSGPPVNPPPASAVPMFHPSQHQPPPHIQPVHQLPGENFNNPPTNQTTLAVPQTHMPAVSPSSTANPPAIQYQQQVYSPQSEHFDQARIVTETHAVESSQTEPTSQPSSQNAVNKWPSDSDDWSNQQSNDEWSNQQSNQEWSQSNNNDGGYQTQRSSRDRGDREQRGGRGKRPFNNGYGGRGRGNYQNENRPFFANNQEGGQRGYYQNGVNKEGQGGFRGRGAGMGARPNRGGMDRGGPRGGQRGGPRGRGGRGGQTQSQGVAAGGPSSK